MEFNHKTCSVVVSSCDAYQDAWEPFFTLFFKYWPDCPFPVYLIANKLKYNDSRVTTINIENDRKWSANLKEALKHASSPSVIYMQEDYFLQGRVDTERIVALVKYMANGDIGYLRLFSSPGPDHNFTNDLDLGEIDKNAPYRTSTQAAIWDVEVLDQLLIDGETGWDFEAKGTARSCRIKKKFLSVKKPVIDYPKATGIKKGGWTYDAIALFEKEGIKINSQRSVRPRFTVCFFGIYDREYSRNRVLMKGLRANGVEILECNSRLSGIKKYFDLIKKHRKLKNKYDCLLVAFPGYQSAILAKLLTPKPIVFDAFFSIYNAKVEDRKNIKAGSVLSAYYGFLDWLSCLVSDKVLLDTNTHADYFAEKLGLDRNKFIRILVGTDPDEFYPRESDGNNRFLVHFHGHFIPLQGTEHIIRAAAILGDESIDFQIIGSGQEYDRVRKIAEDLGVKNIRWISKVPYHQLPKHISEADICLGIFGNTTKAKMVIPNKIYEGIAMAKPVLTADTPATRELFTDRKDIILCEIANPGDIAQKIRELKDDDGLRSVIANGGRSLFESKLTPRKVVEPLVDYLIIRK